jgi:mRNA-degrading endonuclease RelE of RelBE toxin-antitoxin system
MEKRSYNVVINKRAIKNLFKLPLQVQMRLNVLLKDLRDLGPALPQWPNYSKLSGNEYHCHLGYRWVACWNSEKDTLIIEVFYVGSRENAPY